MSDTQIHPEKPIPFFGARKRAKELAKELIRTRSERDNAVARLDRLSSMAQELVAELKSVRQENQTMWGQVQELGILPITELETRRVALEKDLETATAEIEHKKLKAKEEWRTIETKLEHAKNF